ncbi:hypothetical protein [Halopenitus persicus]|uniref:Uncharacterized protein n=1 Tax=Halopenitus persicus TaxID=1048396 RepID=A0A1H3JXU7_9EURY|nr:hypothetical protein [Halopenitus persicus]SDY44094.1 hypothetical protein SAMN05216564_105161 [Halopenitus persicus]
MGTLAIDIETASPDEAPSTQEQFRETSYFELVAIAVGYRDGSGTESDVLFRAGGWEQEHTADLLERLFAWCEGRDVETVLTYNGNGFDRIHLENWSRSLDENGVTAGMARRTESLFATHRDLAEVSLDKYRSRISGGGTSFERICRWEDVDVAETRYADYDLHESVHEGYGSHVKGQHIGDSLGELYVDLHVSGATETTTYRQLKRMLTEYAVADVLPLFELDANL